jgi:hypothetical protein
VIASSDLLLVMYNNGHNISTSIDNLAMSMSNYIRSTGTGDAGSPSTTFSNNDISSTNNMSSTNNTSNMAKGTALAMETYVRVRWAWLTLPVMCVISALFLVVSVILETKKQDAMVWKSSVLAYLFHGLEKTSVEGTIRTEISEMADTAKKVKVRIGRDAEGTWRLVRLGTGLEGVDRVDDTR